MELDGLLGLRIEPLRHGLGCLSDIALWRVDEKGCVMALGRQSRRSFSRRKVVLNVIHDLLLLHHLHPRLYVDLRAILVVHRQVS